MYYYVEDRQFLKRAQSSCSKDMKDLEVLLRDEYEINSQAFLVGSGARNMVTQKENGSIDFDYNLNNFSCSNWDERDIKEFVRKAFNRVMNRQGSNDVEDSTSSLTTKPMWFNNDPEINIKIDVCIVTKNSSGIWERLIHDKTGFVNYDRYYWNIAPNSKDYQEKANRIKSVPRWWSDVLRPEYIEKKNFYLKRNDHNHPSFICYIETINDVYNTMKQKHIL